MTGRALKAARQAAGWTQARLARRLGVTQAYVSQMERERRAVPERVARRAARLLGLSPTALPFRKASLASAPEEAGRTPAVAEPSEAGVVQALARLGCPGVAYLKKPGPLRNPGDVLLEALALDGLDARLAEALPWLLLRFEGFDVEALAARARAANLQNRLGFNAALALEAAQRDPAFGHRAGELARLGRALEPSRLAREEVYGRTAASERMRDRLRASRTPAAAHWNLLTDLRAERLPYVTTDAGVPAPGSS